jgi:calmodulin
MRRRREYDITCLSQLVNEYASEDGTIASTAAEKVLRRLGYCTANAACIEEYAAENKISAQGLFYFDDMYLILQTFRSCEGFLKSEIESFRHVFNSHDMDGSGAIGVVELRGILRAMGYRPDLDEQQRLLDEVDLDHSGEIDFDEFLKLCRRYREDEIHILEQSFQRCRTAKGANDGKVSSNGKLAASEIRVILPALGYARLSVAENKIVDDMAGIEGLDFRQCIELMRRLRTADSDDFREHHGFTPKEEVAWKQRFKSYSASKSILLQQELRSLVQDSYADLLADSEEREKVDEILGCHGNKHPGGSNFCDFLEVLRMIEDRQSHRVILMENEAAVSKGFSRIEVRDYRKMYKLCDCDASKDFQSKDVNALLKVFSSIVPMTPQTQDELRIIIQKCYSKKAVKEGKKLQFIEFLDLMAALTVAAQQAEETAPEAEDLEEDEPSA